MEKAEEVEVDAKSIPVILHEFYVTEKMDQGKEDEKERDDKMENPETKV